MIKKVFRPFWSYNVQKTEVWLESMAENGYKLIRINRFTRCFFFQQGEINKLTYRIGYDKMQGEYLSKGLLAEGWKKYVRSGNWFVTSNEKPLQHIKTSPVREGIIKHNRVILVIFSAILTYFAIMVLVFLTMFSSFAFLSDSQVEVVESPYWIFTYIYFSAEIAILILALYSIIIILKTNKNLIKEKTTQNKLYGDHLSKERLPKKEEKQLKRSRQMIVKRKFGRMYAPDKLELWLESMEEKGLNLYRVSKAGTTFHFIIGRPRRVSYCADYQNFTDKAYFDFHRESGWKSVFISFGYLQKWSIWSYEYSEGEERPQIYSDKSSQLKHARRLAITNSCLFLPLIILYLFILGFRIEIMSIRKIDNSDIFSMLTMIMTIFAFGTYSFKTWLYYRRLKNV